VNVDWLNCSVTATEAANGGFTVTIPISGFREATWDEAFEAHASDPQYQPANQTWGAPRINNDQLVIAGVHDDTDLKTLRRYVGNLVYRTNEQEETRRTCGGGKTSRVAQVDVEDRAARAQRLAETLREVR
jgi:hypothetical protein